MSIALGAEPTILQRLERRLVDRMAQRHLSRLSGMAPGTRGVRSRGVTFWWQAVAVVLVLPVHAVSLAAALGGVVVAVTGDNWPMRVLGGGLLLFAFATKPSFQERPEHVARLTRSDAPAFFGLLDAVAATNGAPVPDELLVVDRFNAFVTRVGRRRRPLLAVGAPLWVAATPQSRVALLGHELGHLAYGDLTHGWWVGTAQQTLHHWLDIAGGMHHVSYGYVYLVERYLMAPLRGLVIGYLYLIAWLNAPAHQRQEYLADLDSARAGGTEAAVALLDVMISEHTVETAMTRAAVGPLRPDMWLELSTAMAGVSNDTLVRRRAVAKQERSRVDDTHPATPLRIELLQSRPRETAQVVMDEALQAAVDAELAPALARAAKEAGDRIRYQR